GSPDMAVVTTPEAARRFVDYWAAEGATWIKIYTDITRANLQATIEQAHKRGMKVTGHLCSVSYQEAVALGIDNLEHGMLTASDLYPNKQPDLCPLDSYQVIAKSADPAGSAAQATIRSLVQHHVPMTSTLPVIEALCSHRPVRDQRSLDMMAPEVRAAYLQNRDFIDSSKTWPFTAEALQRAMAFERAFVTAGGVLGAGVDPTGNGGALPGYGDQRGYELMREAGFSPEQAVQIVSLNGARILGLQARIGSIETGKNADLVLLDGDLAADPTVIRKVVTVFKDGVRFGMVGVGMQGSGLLGESIKLPGVACAGAADLYDGRHTLAREIAGATLPVTRRYQQLLDDKTIDCIVAAVPDHWHRRMVVDAVSAGKDIYCEKPMSHTAADGVAMVDAVKPTNRIVQIGSQRVSSQICAKARELIGQGGIGELVMVEGSLGRNDPTGA